MSKIKILIAALSVLGMLTACGDGFKATVLASGEVAPDPVPPIINPSRHQEIYNSFIGEFSPLNASSINSLKNTMDEGALEVRVANTGQRGTSNRISRVDVTLQLACNHTVSIVSENSNIDGSLKSGILTSIGNNTGYDARLQCVDASCEEMVIAIKRSGALVLVGLGKLDNDRIVSGQTVVDVYKPRDVISQINADENHYSAPRNIANLNAKCLLDERTKALSDAEREQMTGFPTQSQNTASGYDFNDPSSWGRTATVPVNPTGGSQTVSTDPTFTGFETNDPRSQGQTSGFDPLYFDPNQSGPL